MSEQTTEAPKTAKRYPGEKEEVLTDSELDATIARHEKLNGLDYGANEVVEEKTEGETQPASSSDEATEAPKTEAAPDRELDTAMTALRRTEGLSEKALDNMSREDVIALSVAPAKSRSTQDDLQRQLTELRGNKGSQETGSEDSEAQGAPATDVDPSTEAGTLQASIDYFTDEFGPEGGEIFAAALSPLAEQVAELKSALGDVIATNRGDAASSAMDELSGGIYPQLKRAEAREVIESHAAQLVSDGKAANAKAAVLQAAQNVYGEAVRPVDPIQTAREQGVVSPGGFPPTTNHRELSHEEKADALLYEAMDRVEQGFSPD